MSDLISRQAVLDLIEHYNSDGLGSVFYGYQEGIKFADAVNKLPSANAEAYLDKYDIDWTQVEVDTPILV